MAVVDTTKKRFGELFPDFFIGLKHPLDDGIQVQGEDRFSSPFSDRGFIGSIEKTQYSPPDLGGVQGISHQKSILPILNNFWIRTTSQTKKWFATSNRFKRHQTESLWQP